MSSTTLARTAAKAVKSGFTGVGAVIRLATVSAVSITNRTATVTLSGGTTSITVPCLIVPQVNATVAVLVEGTDMLVINQLTAVPWIVPAFLGTWADIGGFAVPVGYRRVDNRVFLRGTLISGTINTNAFTVNSECIPLGTASFGTTSASAFASASVDLAGNVKPVSGATTSFSLNGISWALD